MSDMTMKIEGMKVEKGSLAILWLSQGSFIFKTEHGKIIYIDPYLSNSVERVYGQKRLVPIPIPPEEVRADLVVITHDHLDHLDPDTILPLSKVCDARFLGPLSCVYHLLEIKIDRNRIIEVNRGETKVVEGVKISAVHAEHTENSVGYVFDFDGIKVYISGDTKNHEKLKKVASFHPDVALICANGKPPGEFMNLNANEAALLTKIINPRIVIPMHYGLFAEVDEDPQTFVDALKKQNVPVECIVMDFKGCYLYKKE
jgi:L-ascorbate 6-phosphate lactonase